MRWRLKQESKEADFGSQEKFIEKPLDKYRAICDNASTVNESAKTKRMSLPPEIEYIDTTKTYGLTLNQGL
jgi:hypothetical protein